MTTDAIVRAAASTLLAGAVAYLAVTMPSLVKDVQYVTQNQWTDRDHDVYAAVQEARDSGQDFVIASLIDKIDELNSNVKELSAKIDRLVQAGR